MIEKICYDTSITVFWTKGEDIPSDSNYNIFLNGEKVAVADRTHYTFNDLKPVCDYKVGVEVVSGGKVVKTFEPVLCTTKAVAKRIDVTKEPYNAVGDGTTLNTAALQRALDDCKPGECVYIPEGDYMTGSLKLHSDMELYIDKGAILHGTTNVEDYTPKIHSRFEGIEMMAYAALLNLGNLDRNDGYNCKNVVIRGGGTICGGGRKLAENVVEIEKVLMKDYMDSLGDAIKECETSITIPGRVRPRLINMSNAQNIVISDVEIQNGASWNVHMIYSDNVVTHNCTFRSEKVWNGDGWDPDSSTNCTLFNARFYTGDDAVAVKSGKNPEGNVVNRPCEHIRVFDCVSYYGHGITMGSEMSGGINDVRVWDCDMGDSTYGVEIKGTRKRGGYVRNIRVRDSKVCRVLMHSVGYNDDGIAAPTVPYFEDCTFENLEITAITYGKDEKRTACAAIELSGFDEPGHEIKNIRFKDITINRTPDGESQNISLALCKGLSFENINCK